MTANAGPDYVLPEPAALPELVASLPPEARALVEAAAALEGEVARLRAGAADDPGLPTSRPSPAQWIARFLALPVERRLEWAQTVLEAIDTANRCFEEDHAGQVEYWKRQVEAAS